MMLRPEAIEWLLREAAGRGEKWAARGLIRTETVWEPTPQPGLTSLTKWTVYFRVDLGALTWPA